MFELLDAIPGVVVLHDFFLSHVIAHMEVEGYSPNAFSAELYRSHGYRALQERFHAADPADVVWKYPCNLGILQNAQGVIVHSEYSRRLAQCWYGAQAAEDWMVIPHLRVPVLDCDRTQARRVLNFHANDFIVCSFGTLGTTKLNDRLVQAWLTSPLSKDGGCMLVFVGEMREDNYGTELLRTIEKSGKKERILVTGWADRATFRHYLAAADVAVQLRTLSRGETSGSVLDCMNFGLATIINANGSTSDLPPDHVWKLPDQFTDAELVEALDTLWRDAHLRLGLGARARELILDHHAPRNCADQYAQAIETMYRKAEIGATGLTRSLAQLDPIPPDDSQEWLAIAEAVTRSIPLWPAPRRLLVDVSVLVQHDTKSGVPRIVRKVLKELLAHPPEGYRVEPIYTTPDHGYRYARGFTLSFLHCREAALEDEPIEHQTGDVFLCLARYAKLNERLADCASGVASPIPGDMTRLPDAIAHKLNELDHAVHARIVQASKNDLRMTAVTIAVDEAVPNRKQLLVDITALVERDAKTGIQRVVRSILLQLLCAPPSGYSVEPVFGSGEGSFRYAREFKNRFVGKAVEKKGDNPIEFNPGDIFLGLDLSAHLFPKFTPVLEEMSACGVRLLFYVYDLIAINLPQYCDPGMPSLFRSWLDAITKYANGLICISAATADHVSGWMKGHNPKLLHHVDVAVVHIGADIDDSVPSVGLPDNAQSVLGVLKSVPSFLMVGTIEPRKGYTQALAAFDCLWSSGVNANMVIVGKQGWMVERLVEKLREHPQLNKRLFWLDGISDEYLKKVYGASTALLAASEAEGFGLPLIEAAQHKLPIIARDIPVFREVAGEHAYYFQGNEPIDLANAVRAWLTLYEVGEHPSSDDMPWLTWKQSAERLKEIILEDDWCAFGRQSCAEPINAFEDNFRRRYSNWSAGQSPIDAQPPTQSV
jgi:glycosyltransferase involved in cell wall biosynthesis